MMPAPRSSSGTGDRSNTWTSHPRSRSQRAALKPPIEPPMTMTRGQDFSDAATDCILVLATHSTDDQLTILHLPGRPSRLADDSQDCGHGKDLRSAASALPVLGAH